MSAQEVFELLQSPCSGTQLAKQLETLNAFKGLGRENAVAAYSKHVCDRWPKAHDVLSHLEGKLQDHEHLLHSLGSAVFPKLHASVLRCLFEDSQRLRALMDVRELESKQEEQRAHGDGEGRFPLQEVVLAAGQAAAQYMPTAGADRDPHEVFYACPTATVEQLFKQVAAAAGAAGRQPGQAASDFEAVAQLSKALQVALSGALAQRASQQQLFPAAINAAVAGLNDPELTTSSDVCAALQALAEACCRLHPLLVLEAPRLQYDGVLLLSDLADRLLNACAASVTAAPPGQQRLARHFEYAALRDHFLGQLLGQALSLRQEDEAEHQIRRLQGLAEAHLAYKQLFEVAEATSSWDQLWQQMQQLRGDSFTEPLASYVFERLLKEGRHAMLLDLPQPFDGALQSFLSEEDASEHDVPLRRQLRWLHELRTGDYTGASQTLAQVAVHEQHSGARQRALALQKLSALAACPLWPLAMPGDEQASVAQADEALDQLHAAA
ncbi:hypothetical protein D9Q98_002534 [Chlorella vulgaris]|uniref:Nucleoporin Nup133/Nup155-like C-terminal domain-containing protein n=1 Tax=Chlorella vulgaris TaxID=3077 RepID=A0A9D4TTM6_CHLVU|nr:hypothetical protein D9Q98_002534 [Chlorella vulgaris]